MADINYDEIADRIESGSTRLFTDMPDIMDLIGHETIQHGRLGTACRPVGGTHWGSVPRVDSADAFDLWILNRKEGALDGIGIDPDGRYWVTYSDAKSGRNEYGRSMRLGRAMWAAFVRAVGGIDNG